MTEISTLMILTLAAAAVIGIVLLTRFLRKPQNRHPMAGERERSGDEIAEGRPPHG